ncbi:class A sortase [Alkalihalobacillus sp. LMS6]|uniref:class A sortase n=1 Tax=Alkalihalobacillus sp. LMS6 TaxID=2924034 RepID=UPI0020D1DECE|nr:class A sortase [Alkalihalobacillus sp. LMS6]UTR08236.1 class A sortase [Alkalihalobacillus sp. LMS6]
MTTRLKEFLTLGTIIVFLGVGIVLVCSPFIRDYGIESQIARAQTTFSENNLQSLTLDEPPVDFVIERPRLMDVLRQTINSDEPPVVGAISIPDVDVLLPIMDGLTNEHLLAGAATLTTKQEMGSSNYVLFGHHLTNSSLLFGPLLHVQPEMKIFITDKQAIYEFIITETNVISERDTQFLISTDEPALTLFTCDTSQPTTNRFMVRATLDSTYIYENESEKAIQFVQ